MDLAVLKHAIRQHQRRLIVATNEEIFQHTNVQRSDLYQDAFHALSKHTFNLNKMLKVCFSGQPAIVDDGGPTTKIF